MKNRFLRLLLILVALVSPLFTPLVYAEEAKPQDTPSLEEIYEYVKARLISEGWRPGNPGHTVKRIKSTKQAGSASELPLYGQTRNTMAVKISNCEFDIAGTIALLDHWYLYASVGGTDMPDKFMDREFPDRECDQEFLYNALFGMGFNWRLGNSRFAGSPFNLFVGAMAGPAICHYKADGSFRDRGYFMARVTVGADIPIYRGWGLTADFSLDRVKDFELAPRYSVGLQYSFRDWGIFRRQ